ncbi:hypothetical protein [Pontibacter sp. G13]|uniref:hypothetical protein n=1 Tax=Pontibacter sp. G13 TaxID=3074898 RepID=UPI00288A96B2|nr:hypothetical protein [Pontibacter sp. G13]WNJ19043.1 hypothetical protein RJD25_01010 [Pontibacter sp. G13]
MNPQALSDLQLFLLLRDEKLPEPVHQAALKEFQARNFSSKELKTLRAAADTPNPQATRADFKLWEKVFFILFPPFIILHFLVAGRYLIRGEFRLWDKFWKLITISFLLWTVVAILIFR